MPTSFSFDCFVLDSGDRRLRAGGAPVDLNARYFDALALLVNEQGRLVAKERFMAEVWAGVPVTDEALTQCIRTLRRQLGDSASHPRFIETVPKHGYRFIAPVRLLDGVSPPPAITDQRLKRLIASATRGTIGGAVAGIIGGVIYGFASASRPADAGVGAISVLLVVLAVTVFVAVVGAAGVSLAIAAAQLARPRSWAWSMAGGAGGGLIVGALGNLLGRDAFTLLVGHSPNGITGAAEGALLGAAVGLSAFLAAGVQPLVAKALRGAIAGGIAGIIIGLAGGRLMLGSLALLVRDVPGSRLRLDQIGHLFGESGAGPITLVVTGGLEAALFAACIVAAVASAPREG